MSKVFIKLGDIIKIKAKNDRYNDKTFFVKYLDNDELILLHDLDLEETTLILQDGEIVETNIEEITIIDRAKENGYVLQNNLIIDAWIDIHIEGDVPVIITGKITNIEEDMIEVVTFNEKKTIYIDFEYKGLPKNPPITKIIRRSTLAIPLARLEFMHCPHLVKCILLFHSAGMERLYAHRAESGKCPLGHRGMYTNHDDRSYPIRYELSS